MIHFIQQTGDFLAGGSAQTMYWIFALAGSAIFLFTGALHLFGVGAVDAMPDGVDVDLDGSVDIPHPDTGFFDFKLLSLRTILAFLTMFGWGGVVFGSNGWIGFLAAFFCGLVTMVITAFSICMILKLQQSGTRANKDFVGRRGVVYLTIPAGRAASGKVTLGEGDSTREITAVSDEELKTGTAVVVTAFESDRFVVRKA